LNIRFFIKLLILLSYFLALNLKVSGDPNSYEKILFSDDDSLRTFFNEKYGWDKKNISKNDLDSYREEYCEAFRFKEFQDQLKEKDIKLKNFCSKYLGIKKKVIKEEKKVSINDQIFQEENKTPFELCKEAKDFEGCMKTLIPSKDSNVLEEKDELDFMGFPKLNSRDWHVYKNKVKRSINYYSIKAKKVKVRGTYGRYINFTRVYRFYREGRAGTSPQIISSGSSYADCYDLGSTISCSGYGPSITTIPGRPSIPGGNKQVVSEIIIDCFEDTYQVISDKFGQTKWKSLVTNQTVKMYRNNFCGIISDLAKSSVTKFEKGSPTDKDLKAKNSLVGKIYY